MVYMFPGRDRTWVIDGSYDITDIQLAILDISPETDDAIDTNGQSITIYRDRIKIKEAPGGGGVWEAIVTYAATQDRTDLSFNFGVKVTKAYTALGTVLVYDCVSGASGADGTLADIPAFENQLGVTDDKIEGADLERADVQITITKKWKRSDLDIGYFLNLRDLTSPYTAVNDADYTINILGQKITFAKGSLRFRGAQTKLNSEDQLEIVYNFAYEGPIVEADQFKVGNSAVITKEGQQYLWVWYQVVSSNGRTVLAPKAAIVNQVFPYKDFKVLDLDD